MSIVHHDPNFARVYLKEKFFLWKHSLKNGHVLLRAFAEMQLREAGAALDLDFS